MQLQVHLEGEQYIIFEGGDSPNVPQIQDTHLTAFFKANDQFPEARTVRYPEFPSKFTWHRKGKYWYPRKKGNTSGRMIYVHPGAGERFYIRLLLSITTNVHSFEQLRSFNGVTYATFREACFARGLLADDNEWIQALDDARFMHTGWKLQQIFVTIVRENQPAQPAELWEKFKTHLCDDLPHRLRHQSPQLADLTEDLIFDYGLFLIQVRLEKDDRTMRSVGLPRPRMPWDSLLSSPHPSRLIVYNPIDQACLLDDTLPRLNAEQQFAFSTILQSVLAHEPLTFFLQGAAGAGKTFVYNTLCFAVRAQELRVMCVASSGIAALLLPGGRTAHSSFKIPLEINESSSCSISK